MRCKTLVVLVAVAAAIGCSSSSSTPPGPAPEFSLVPVSSSAAILSMPGPMNLQYQLTVTNPLDVPITVRDVELRALAPSPYTLRRETIRVRLAVAPKSSATKTITTWGYSQGGTLNQDIIVTIEGLAHIDTPNGARQQLFRANFQP